MIGNHGVFYWGRRFGGARPPDPHFWGGRTVQTEIDVFPSTKRKTTKTDVLSAVFAQKRCFFAARGAKR